MAAVQAEDVRASNSCLWVVWMAMIRSGWVQQPRIIRVFPILKTVSGCDQFVVGPTHERAWWNTWPPDNWCSWPSIGCCCRTYRLFRSLLSVGSNFDGIGCSKHVLVGKFYWNINLIGIFRKCIGSSLFILYTSDTFDQQIATGIEELDVDYKNHFLLGVFHLLEYILLLTDRVAAINVTDDKTSQ